MLTGSHHINVRNAGVLVDRLISTMTLSPARLAPGSRPCRTKTAVNRRSNVYPKKQSVVLLDWNNSDDALLGKTRKRLRISTHSNWSACEINGETIALEVGASP